MPGPMPPPGGPPQGPPQGPPPGQSGPQQAPPAGGSPDAGKFLQTLDQAIDSLAQNIMGDKSAPPEAKQLAQQIDQAFGKLMDMIQGGGGQDSDEGDAQGQTVPPEAAGNKGAIPSPM